MTLRITRLAIISFLIAVPGVSAGGHGHGGGNVGVRGYYNGRGTHVSPHMRSAPDGNFWNNWSTYGNVNPYTGVPGTKRQNPNIGSTGGGYTNNSDSMMNSIEIPPGLTLFTGGFALSSPASRTKPTEEMTETERLEFERIRELKRKESLDLAEKGLAFYNAGQFLSAATEYGWAIDRDPTNSKLFYCRGIMFSRLKRFDESIHDLLAALQIDPSFKEARAALDYAMSRKVEISRATAR